MLVGAHVSTSGGLVRAHERGVEWGCDAIQIFHQNPRMWRPTAWKDEDVEEFNERLAAGPVRAVAIHAVYLINCASKDTEIRRKSLDSLIHALRLGDAIGAVGVVLHPGSQVKEPYEASMERVGEALRHALAESESCPLLLENTAGAGGTLGRSFEELAQLIELGGAHERLGLCLDCCHMLASGFDITSAEKLETVIDQCVEIAGLERLACLHVNDSQVPLGGNRDRHAPLPEGELGEDGLAAFLSEPRFEGLPALLETPPTGGREPGEQMPVARALREHGLAARGTT
ncbi:MAG: deoxyribonuclease IV [Thermoleophilaceae bacterium]